MADDISGAEHRAVREPLRFARIVVIGGGCYGSWYVQQLARAIERSALVADEILVVDRNPECRVASQLRGGMYAGLAVRHVRSEWAPFVAAWLSAEPASLAHDAMVPSPLMPHLCFDWLIGVAQQHWPGRRISTRPLPAVPPTPWERASPDGRHYVSFATWTCPVNCIEPARCPATRGARDWSMPVAIQRFAAEEREAIDHALIFHCEHRTYGVGMIDASTMAQSVGVIANAVVDQPLRLLVGTVSHCHGALGLLTID